MNGFPTVADPVNVSHGPFGWPTRTVTGLYRSNGYPDPLRASPAVKLLREAVFYIDAANSQTGERRAINQGSGGAALDALYGGNVAAVTTNYPLLLTKRADEPNYLYTPSATASYLSVPDAAAFTPTTSLDVRCVITADDWTPATSLALAGQYGGAGDRSWAPRLVSTGAIQLLHSVDGTAELTATSSVTLQSVVSLSDGATPLAIRVMWEAATPSVKLYWKVSGPLTAYADALDDSGWTQLGATVTGASVGASIFGSPATVGLAGRAGIGADAKHYATVVKVDGVLQAGFNAAVDITSSSALTFPITTGQTATLTQATSGRRAVLVTRPCWLLGTDDYLEVPNHPLLDMANNQSFTVLAVIRQWATPVSNGRLLNKRAGSGPGWLLQASGTTQSGLFYTEDVHAAAVQAVSAASSAGALRCFTGVRNVGRTSVSYLESTGVSATNRTLSLTNVQPFRIGCRSDSVNNVQDFELVAAAVFRRALTTTEIATINTGYGT